MRYHSHRYNSYHNNRRHIFRYVVFIWVLLAIITFIFELELQSSVATMVYWYLPAVFALIIGVGLAIRVYRYALRSHFHSAWTRRLQMAAGIFVTAIIVGVAYVTLFFSSLGLPGGTFASLFPSTSILEYNVIIGILFNILAIDISLLFAFLLGEAYLFYRLQHHFTVSHW